MSESLNEDSTFYQEIESDSTICTNCYRKLRNYSKPHYTMPESLPAIVEYEDHTERVWVEDKSNSGRPSVSRSACSCGDIDGAKLRPLENREIMEIAQRIEDHLDDKDIEIDSDVYFSYLREHRRGSDMQFNEEVYFEEAIERALIEEEEERTTIVP